MGEQFDLIWVNSIEDLTATIKRYLFLNLRFDDWR